MESSCLPVDNNKKILFNAYGQETFVHEVFKMEFTTTERGSRKLLKDGFLYVFKKNLSDGSSSWECELRRRGLCRASVKLDVLEDFQGMVNEHTHPPSQVKCEIAKVKSNIKRRATETLDPARQILSGEVRNIQDAVAVNLPLNESIRRNIRLQRQIRHEHPNPIAIGEIPADLPREITETTTGERFLIFDSGVEDPNRILMFAGPNAVELMKESKHWFADGTFKVSPRIFFQLYTVHALLNERVIPCIYALLPNKTLDTYNRLFQALANVLVLEEQPDDFLMDFELAAMNAGVVNFPGVEMKGCFFHFTSNLWKRVQRAGLQERYNNDANLANDLRMLAALAFVPPNDVIGCFEEVVLNIRNTHGDDLNEVIAYIENNYIGMARDGDRRAPTFSIELWNMFHRTFDELPRTNNSIEGWHRSFQATVGINHPTLWRFLDVLRQEEALNRMTILQMLGGHPAPAVRRRYADANQRILRLVDNYANLRLQYLRSIAHNLGLGHV